MKSRNHQHGVTKKTPHSFNSLKNKNMKKFSELLEYHLDNGFWSSVNDTRYGYELSPVPFYLNSDLQNQLTDIGKVVANIQEGSKRLFKNVSQSNGRTESSIRKIFEQAGGGLPMVVSEQKMPLTKVDLIIDVKSQIKIAEIDSYNPRGIVYALLLRDIFKEYSGQFYSGCGAILSAEMEARETTKLLWIYAMKERYYLQGFLQFQRIMNQYGKEIKVQSAASLKDVDMLSLMIPWGMNDPVEQLAKKMLIDKYMNNDSQFLFPLHPWMGTKGILGMLSNSCKNEALESLAQYHFSDVDMIRQYIPPTTLISKRNATEVASWVNGDRNVVLKGNVASGLKSVFFSADKKEEYVKNLLVATSMKQPSYIMQEEVQQKTFRLPYYKNNGTLEYADWYLRLIIHVDSSGQVVDAEITGRRTKDVHGAPDCIQLPCTI